MLKIVSDQDRMMIRQVVRSERGRDLVDWLQEQAGEMAHRSLSGDGADMHRVQGASIILTELVSLMRLSASK